MRTAWWERLSRVAIATALSPTAANDRSRFSSSADHAGPGALISSPSARVRLGAVCSRCAFACLWLTRCVLISERSKLCPFSSRATPKVARHPGASMVDLPGAGLASFCFRLEPEIDQAANYHFALSFLTSLSSHPRKRSDPSRAYSCETRVLPKGRTCQHAYRLP